MHMNISYGILQYLECPTGSYGVSNKILGNILWEFLGAPMEWNIL